MENNMYFTLDTQAFLTVAGTVAKSINSKETQVQTLLSIENGNVVFTHFGGTSFFKGGVAIKDSSEHLEERSWPILGNQFKLILGVISKDSEDLTFELGENDSAFTIISGSSKLRLPISDIDGNFKEEQVSSLGFVDAVQFLSYATMLTRLAVLSEAYRTKAFSCLNIISKGEEILITATSTYALAEKVLSFTKSDGVKDFEVLIKPAQAGLLSSSSFLPGDTIELLKSDNMVGYVDTNGVLCLVGTADMNAFKNPVNNKTVFDSQVKLDSSSVKLAVDSATKLCANNSSIVMEVEGGTVLVKNLLNDIFKVEGEGQVERTRLGFHRQSLQVLLSLLSDTFSIEWTRSGSSKMIVSFKNIQSDGTLDESLFITISSEDI